MFPAKIGFLFFFVMICFDVRTENLSFNRAFLFESGQKADYIEIEKENLSTTAPEGRSAVWNFHFLETDGQVNVFNYKSADETDYQDQVPDFNIGEFREDGTAMLFYQNKQHSFMKGLVEPERGIVIQFDEMIPLYSRPLKYSDSTGGKGKRSFSYAGIGFSGEGSSYSVVDGQGKLILPEDTFDNVLRIKTVQDFEDSGPLGMRVKSYIESYSWLIEDLPFPVLSIDSLYREDPFSSATEIKLRILKDYDSNPSGSQMNSLPETPGEKNPIQSGFRSFLRE